MKSEKLVWTLVWCREWNLPQDEDEDGDGDDG
jgi:hypothetical protein